MGERVEYECALAICDRTFTRVVIDQHYRLKHGDSMNDLSILQLVRTLNGQRPEIETEDGGFTYMTVDRIFMFGKPYRLILCMNQHYLGVINAFRVNP